MSEFKGTKGNWEYKVIRSKSQTKITVQIPETKYESKKELILGYLDREDDCGVSSCCKITEHANAKLIACAPEMFKETNETIIDLKILRNQILDALKTNHLFEGMPELIDRWIERKENLIKKATE